jgi:ATP-dependent Lon protease
MEFYDTNFSYIDLGENKEYYVTVSEQSSGKLIPEGSLKPGHLFTVGNSSISGKLGVYKIETEKSVGTGKFDVVGVGSKKETKEAIMTAYKYLKSNYRSINSTIDMDTTDYLMEVQDLMGVGITNQLSLACFVGLCSVALDRQILPSTAILGDFSIGGTINKLDNLADILQLCLDSGATKVLLPISSSVDIATVPAELFGKFTLIFYDSPTQAVFKALGVE